MAWHVVVCVALCFLLALFVCVVCDSFVFFLIVCLISMCGCCVRGLLSDAVWLLLFVLLCLCVFV